MEEYKSIILEKKDNVSIITMNQPEIRNSLNPVLQDELLDVFAKLRDDPETHVVIYTGNGKSFCAGANLDYLQEGNAAGPRTVKSTYDAMYSSQTLLREIMDFPRPVIGAINGSAAGAGFSLALACDLLIAADSAFFVETFATIVGVIPDLASIHMLTKTLGTYRAKELMMLGERITAEKAKNLGFVNEVVPDDQLKDHAFEVAKRLAKGPGIPLELIKTLSNRVVNDNLEESLLFEAFGQAMCFTTEDFQEGVNAFLEKRKPNFQSR
jgi:2-(1,2-epoxy-1,2-dihydrophenyl)acetyl-CoA isomerase